MEKLTKSVRPLIDHFTNMSSTLAYFFCCWRNYRGTEMDATLRQ